MEKRDTTPETDQASTFEEHECVRLNDGRPGTIVHVYPKGTHYEVETFKEESGTEVLTLAGVDLLHS